MIFAHFFSDGDEGLNWGGGGGGINRNTGFLLHFVQWNVLDGCFNVSFQSQSNLFWNDIKFYLFY